VRLVRFIVVLAALAVVAPTAASADPKGKGARVAAKRVEPKRRSHRPTGSTKVCSTKKVGKRTKKVCKRVPLFSGHNAPRSTLRTEPLERPSGALDVVVPHWGGERLSVQLYKDRDAGTFDEAVLAQLDDLFRCKRSHEVRAMDPRLYEMLSRISDHFDRKPIELVSAFRFVDRNSSRHYHASAVDFRIQGIPLRELRDYAESLDMGNMGLGIYPTSGFIHFDYRAPGEPSFRWTDLTGPGDDGTGKKKKKKNTGRTKPARKPTS
jgi:hypothetical protein